MDKYLDKKRNDSVDSEMENTKNICNSLGIDYWNWLGVYRSVLANNYIISKKAFEILPFLYSKMDESSLYIIKNITQNNFALGKEHCLKKSEEEFIKYKTKLFNWLDNTDNPYFFIFQPVWHYNTFVSKNGYDAYIEPLSGVCDETIEIAKDYAIYKISKNIIKQ